MREIVRKDTNKSDSVGVKLGGLVCNKSAPSIKTVKLGGLVCNKSAPSVKACYDETGKQS